MFREGSTFLHAPQRLDLLSAFAEEQDVAEIVPSEHAAHRHPPAAWIVPLIATLPDFAAAESLHIFLDLFPSRYVHAPPEALVITDVSLGEPLRLVIRDDAVGCGARAPIDGVGNVGDRPKDKGEQHNSEDRKADHAPYSDFILAIFSQPASFSRRLFSPEL